jgi:uncharacterized phiE125 gp8 family phage protein
MRVTVIDAPAPLISLDEAKAHLRVDDDAEDSLIEAMIAAAQEHIDGPAGWLGRSLGEQTLELARPGFADRIALPYGPIIEVDAIEYDDADGAVQILDPAVCRVYGDQVALAPGSSWPAVLTGPESVRITYVAGYREAVPAAAIAAVKLMVDDMFRNRGTVTVGSNAKVEMSTTVERLLAPLRIWSDYACDRSA